MKLRFLTLFFLLLILPGCIKDHFSDDFTWGYSLVNDRYCSISSHEFKEGKRYKMAFCQLKDDLENMHILLIMKDKDSKFKVFGEIVLPCAEIDKIYLKDVNNDSADEILIFKTRPSLSEDEVYSIDDSGDAPYLIKLKDKSLKYN